VVPDDGSAVFDEERLAARGGGELAQLGAGELDERRRQAAAPTLEKDECGQQRRRHDASGGFQLHLERNRVARGGGGEVGREVETKHGCGKCKIRE
jgi:hypothetical protein